MKYFKINFAGIIAIACLLASTFSPYLARLITTNENLIKNLTYAYVLGYLAFKISYMETKNVFLMFLPLIIHCLTMAVFVNRGNLSFKILRDLPIILTKLYDLILIILVFFILEYLINRLLGSLTASLLALLCFLVYLIILTDKYLGFLSPYKNFFLYFAIFVMALRIRSAARVNPILIGLAFGLFALEIYLKYTYTIFDYDFLFSLFPLIYICLKTVPIGVEMSFVDYIIFSLIYIYPSLAVIIKNSLALESLSVAIISLLISYILAEIIYKISNKYLSLALLGIR